MIQSSLRFILKLLIAILLIIMPLEIGLRIFPALVPLPLLPHYHPEPRSAIALARNLPVKKWHTYRLNRDDGGPELRVYKPFAQRQWVLDDDGTFYNIILDETGFCNPPKVASQTHIDLITLGDSFTFCTTVYSSESWSSRLAELSGWSVYNLGKEAIGIHEYLQILKQFGLQKSPKMVVMNIYEGNDLRDAQLYRDYLKNPTEQPPPTSSNSPLTWLLKYSYAINLPFSLVTYLRQTQWPADEESPSPGQTTPEDNLRYQVIFPTGEAVDFNPLGADQDELIMARQLYGQQIKLDTVEFLKQPLQTFKELSQQHGFIPVVTYTPSAHTAYSDWVQFADPELHILMPSMSQRQRAFLSDITSELSLTFIDLTPALQAATKNSTPNELLYYRYNLHLTAKGHAVVAEALYPQLADRLAE